ncbi:hypothetical protein [Capnocytophaga sp.]|uniref:hypothetical protein n=1 Tax=Capnocytophaga sp. TaxID=44737 RepID=UPI0026DDC9B7|nr:hypothetical protein [Capnocytophaga sp.]MDO5106156.1 hypothetical protein [Capnocytophaga sp.]
MNVLQSIFRQQKHFLWVLFWLIATNVLANTPFVQHKYTETKKENKTFNVSDLPSLFVSNKYGTITLVADDNLKTIKIDVTVKTSSDDADRAKERLKDISIDFSQKGSAVSAKTLIQSSSSSFVKKFWKSNTSVSIRIDYTISLPTKTKISLESQYGDIFLNKTDSELKINASYGSVNLEKINAEARLQLNYSPNTQITEIQKLYLDGDYSTISVEKAQFIKLSMDYTTLKISEVSQIDAHCKYGNLTVEKAASLSAHSAYTNLKINALSKQATISSKYGNLSVRGIAPSVNSLTIDGAYTSISIGYHKDWEFSYEFSNSFSKPQLPANLPYDKKNIGNISSFISGTKGKGGNTLKINSSFGGVKVNEF